MRQFRGVAAAKGAANPGQPVERIVVEHENLAVARRPDVTFDPIAAFDRRPRGAKRIFDDPALRIVQAAMGDRARDQPAGPAFHGVISKIASTSTQAPSGSCATPIVERAWAPASPAPRRSGRRRRS